MSRVDKFNPLAKGSAIDQKRDELRGGTCGKAQIEEPKFAEIRRDAINYGLASDVLYPISAGKEASIFLALWKDHPIVLKAYRLWSTPHKLSTAKGHIRESSGKKTRWILGLIEDIAVAEFDVLQDCFRAGMNVPTPIGRVGNMVSMRLIGDYPTPAPQLRDVILEEPEIVLDEILDDYLIMYSKVHFVHGDLSSYNILWWQDRHWIIDLPQAYHVGPWSDMTQAEMLLRRDIKNLLKHFRKYGVKRNADEILETFLCEYIPDNLRNYNESLPSM